MPTSMLVAVGVSVALAFVMVALAGPILRRLPPPSQSGPIAPWHHLPHPRWLIGLGACSALSCAIGLLLAPSHTAPLWIAWAGPAALLIAIDAATTWLPLSFTRVCGVVLLVATATSMALGLPLQRLMVMAISAAIAYGLFWAMWRISGGAIGFGDVRLAALVGALSGAVSISFVIGAMITGSMIGVAMALGYRILGHSGVFPYGPALWAGPQVFLLLHWAVQLFN